MQPFPHEVAWAAAASALGFGVVQTARLKWRAGLAGRQLRKRVARARAGEAHAVDLLARAGFRVVDQQPVARWEVSIDGAPRPVHVRADFLVERDGRSFVAEVKTGAEAPSVSTRETRRQLLEYACAFSAHGVLLVDVEAGRVEEVAFALPVRRAPPRRRGLLLSFVLGVLAGAAALSGWVYRTQSVPAGWKTGERAAHSGWARSARRDEEGAPLGPDRRATK